jgi:predicted DNA repair protein MutK
LPFIWNQSIDSNERTLVYYRFKVVVSGITGQSIILLLGGLFLIYKSTSEIREKSRHQGHEEKLGNKIISKCTFTNHYD